MASPQTIDLVVKVMEKVLQIAKTIIVKEVEKAGCRVNKILLFGSRARGEACPDSDWDFYLDEVYIPYYDPKANRIARFKPDFIFWLQKDNRYFILFVDPKGTEHTAYERKVDGYQQLFQVGNTPKVFQHNGLSVSVHLFLRTEDVNKFSQG